MRALRLQFQGAVVYVEAVEEGFHAVGNLFEHCGVGDDDVAGEGGLRR